MTRTLLGSPWGPVDIPDEAEILLLSPSEFLHMHAYLHAPWPVRSESYMLAYRRPWTRHEQSAWATYSARLKCIRGER